MTTLVKAQSSLTMVFVGSGQFPQGWRFLLPGSGGSKKAAALPDRRFLFHAR